MISSAILTIESAEFFDCEDLAASTASSDLGLVLVSTVCSATFGGSGVGATVVGTAAVGTTGDNTGGL